MDGSLGTDCVSFVRSPCLEEEERFRVLVKMTAQELSNGIPDSGHLYASVRASRTLTPAGDLQETFSGMDQVTSLRSIVLWGCLAPRELVMSRLCQKS